MMQRSQDMSKGFWIEVLKVSGVGGVVALILVLSLDRKIDANTVAANKLATAVEAHIKQTDDVKGALNSLGYMLQVITNLAVESCSQNGKTRADKTACFSALQRPPTAPH